MSTEYLVRLVEGGEHSPLFFAPAAGSTPLAGVHLGRSLGDGRSVYAFSLPGLEHGDCPFSSVGELAAAFIAEIRTAQGSSPYHLAGHCWGGTLVFEIASQLESSGHQVAAVILMESFPPHIGEPIVGGLGARVHEPELFAAEEIKKAHQASDKHINEQISKLPARYAEQFERYTRQLIDMSNHYTATAINAPLTLFRTSSYHDVVFEDWKRLSTVPICEYFMPGDSYGMLSPPLVLNMAEKIQTLLN